MTYTRDLPFGRATEVSLSYKLLGYYYYELQGCVQSIRKKNSIIVIMEKERKKGKTNEQLRSIS